MAARVIAFPARRPTDREAMIERIRAYVAQSWADPAASRLPDAAPPVSGPREDEILQLLRRIDRRLARLTTVQGTPP